MYEKHGGIGMKIKEKRVNKSKTCKIYTEI